MSKKLRRSVLSAVTAAALLTGMVPYYGVIPAAVVHDVQAADAESANAAYKFRAQLKTAEEIKIYDILAKMAENGDFLKGTARAELDVAQDTMSAYMAGDAALSQAFHNARDAFMMDSSDIFYVDWTKLTLRVGFDENGKYYAFIGNGPYKNFYNDNGYTDEASILAAKAQIEETADKIIADAKTKTTEIEQIKAVHDALIEMADYLDPDDFSTFHGANICGILLNGEAWCEGYSRAFQYIMQRMGKDCVLVLGGGIPTYGANGDSLYTPSVEEHMWNYVQLSNGKWYGVDVTYDDPTVITAEGKKSTVSDKFFLKGADGFMANHVESGQFSQGGKGFTYPVLSQTDPGKEKGSSLSFRTSYVDDHDYQYSITNIYPTFTTPDGKELKGKEIVQAGYYTAIRDVYVDMDGNISRNIWRDISKTGFEYSTDEGCFNGYAMTDTTKGITLVAYDFAVVKNAPNNVTAWNGAMDIIAETDEPIYLRALYVDQRASSVRKIYQDPPSSYPMNAECQKVTLRFDAPLELMDDTQKATVSVSSDMYGAEFRVDNMLWKNKDLENMGVVGGGCEVTFDFYPDTSMNYNGAVYTFTLGNLQSTLDKSKPASFTLQCAKPMPSIIPCAKTPSPSKLTVPIQPTLLKNSFDSDMFTDPKGNLIKESGSSLNISLIASKPSAAEQAKLDEALGIPDAVESATFDLSLSCAVMRTALKYHSDKGTKVTLALPYPNGYDSRKLEGVTFEAYHFTKQPDGSYKKEKLICNATETGIFIQADSFSPFTVVAVPEESHVSDGGHALSVITDPAMASVTAADGEGNALDADLIYLMEGESVTVTFTPAEDYSMERMVLNGETAAMPELSGGTYSVTYTYDDLSENNTLIADFCADSVMALEAAAGITSAEPTAFDPAVCVNNDQPEFEAVETEIVQNIQSVSAEETVLTLPDEGTEGTPEATEKPAEPEQPVEEYIDKVVGYSLTLKGDIGVNFYMELSESVIADETAYMQFTLPNGDVVKVPVSEAVKSEKNGTSCYVFSCGVPAKDMTGEILAQVFSGGNSGDVHTYSVKKYADKILDESSGASEETKVLVKAMLNAGGYAQAYFGHNTDAMANDGIDSTLADVNVESKSSYEKKIGGLTYYGTSLLLKSSTVIRHYFTLAEGEDIGDYVFTLGSHRLTPVEKSGKYYVEIPNVAANIYDKQFTVKVNGTDAVTYGVYDYIANIIAKNNDEALVNTVKALWHFGEAAKAYAESK